MTDKFTAVWISHSSISDYLKCPRLYYLRNMYRDSKTHHKISLMQPSLALGQVVHDVLDEISRFPAEVRFKTSLLNLLDIRWKSVEGKLGGFLHSSEEEATKEKAKKMLTRIMENPGPLKNKAIKIKQDLPHYFLSEEENIILCGKIDWLEYIDISDSVHIIDFKTGKFDEDSSSLQLPIYYLLVKNTQSRTVAKASYWYLLRDTVPKEVMLPDEQSSTERVLEIGKKIALARKLEHLKCKQKDGCHFCKPYEDIINGKAECVGANTFGQDIYILPREEVAGEANVSMNYPVEEPF
jgi:CRISPR/Cas system-associated exonuclease Cas4 (RecB family)